MPENLDVDDEHLREAEALRLRHISEEQLRTFEGYMAEIFTAFGLDLDTSATRTTFWRGAYDENAALRGEFFSVCGVHQ
jgi:hypothetical protein